MIKIALRYFYSLLTRCTGVSSFFRAQPVPTPVAIPSTIRALFRIFSTDISITVSQLVATKNTYLNWLFYTTATLHWVALFAGFEHFFSNFIFILGCFPSGALARKGGPIGDQDYPKIAFDVAGASS